MRHKGYTVVPTEYFGVGCYCVVRPKGVGVPKLIIHHASLKLAKEWIDFDIRSNTPKKSAAPKPVADKLRRLKRDLQSFLSDLEHGVLMDEPLLTGGEDEEFTSLVRLRKTLSAV